MECSNATEINYTWTLSMQATLAQSHAELTWIGFVLHTFQLMHTQIVVVLGVPATTSSLGTSQEERKKWILMHEYIEKTVCFVIPCAMTSWLHDSTSLCLQDDAQDLRDNSFEAVSQTLSPHFHMYVTNKNWKGGGLWNCKSSKFARTGGSVVRHWDLLIILKQITLSMWDVNYEYAVA